MRILKTLQSLPSFKQNKRLLTELKLRAVAAGTSGSIRLHHSATPYASRRWPDVGQRRNFVLLFRRQYVWPTLRQRRANVVHSCNWTVFSALPTSGKRWPHVRPTFSQRRHLVAADVAPMELDRPAMHLCRRRPDAGPTCWIGWGQRVANIGPTLGQRVKTVGPDVWPTLATRYFFLGAYPSPVK